MYEVAVLVEDQLSPADATTIAGLHAEAPEPAHYHVVVPVQDAVDRVASTLAALGADTVAASSQTAAEDGSLANVQREVLDHSRHMLVTSLAALRTAGVSADGEVTAIDPIDRLTELVSERQLFEVVVVARPHPFAATFHVDWTHRARRRLGLPVLHLIASKYPGAVSSEYPDQF